MNRSGGLKLVEYMKKILFLIVAISFSVLGQAQWIRNNVFTITGEYDDSTKPEVGLEKILVFKTLSGASISYETETGNRVNFYTYENSIGDKTPISSTSNSSGSKTIYTISNLHDSRGLLVEDNSKMLAVWIIDYSQHPSRLQSIEPVEAADKCEALKLFITNNSDALEYRGTAGQVKTIDRQYELKYKNLEWNEDEHRFREKEIVISRGLTGTEIILTGDDLPLMNTEFTLSGDQFATKFNQKVFVTSSEYQAVAVQAHMQAIQVKEEVENEGQGGDALGGSAPVDIDFYGYGNEPVVYFYTWFVYDKKDMENPIARYTDKDFSYTFEQAGKYEVKLEVANAESSCVTTTSVEVDISISELSIPNFFSPGSSPGSNDEFKVYYKSIVKYHITIFNRWGNKVWESRNPAEGWDGRYGGKLVNPGVYYYSIQAVGSDNVKYNEGGDINILR